MSANSNAVNEAAINAGALSLLAATALFVGTTSTSFEGTYVHKTQSAVTADASLEGNMIQRHSVAKTISGFATGTNTGLVSKPGAATFDGDASIFATGILPQPGGNFFADAEFTPTGRFISPMSATPIGTATMTVDNAGVNFLVQAEWAHQAKYNEYFEAFMTADPSILANGEVYYQHFVGWQRFPLNWGTAELDFLNNEPKLLAAPWNAFGGAEFDVEVNYVDRITNVLSGTATINALGSAVISATATVPTATGSFTPTPTKFSIASATFDSGDATFPAILARTRQLLNANMSAVCDTEVVGAVTIVQNGGYVDFITTSISPTVEGLITRGVTSNLSAESTIYALSYVWATRQGESSMFANSTKFSAGAILGPDSDVFLRPEEIKDFIRPSEIKDFTRPLI